MKKLLLATAIASLQFFTASATMADEKTKGHGPIDEVNAATRTITVNQKVYTVPLRCDVRRTSGAKVALAELRGALRPGAALVASNEIDFIRFEAVKKAGVWEMVEVTVLDGASE